LCRAGGVAAFLLLFYSVATMVQMVALGAPPETAAEAFALLHGNRILGLLRLDLPTVLALPLYYFVGPDVPAVLAPADQALRARGRRRRAASVNGAAPP
jgi:hypothetical protein